MKITQQLQHPQPDSQLLARAHRAIQRPQPDSQLLARAHRAIRVLESRKKAVIKEHSERTKRLRNAVDALTNAALDPDDMMSLPFSLAPELIALIENPEEGL